MGSIEEKDTRYIEFCTDEEWVRLYQNLSPQRRRQVAKILKLGSERRVCKDGESTWKMLTPICCLSQETKMPCFLVYMMAMVARVCYVFGERKENIEKEGAKVAQYASTNLYKKIIMQPAYSQNRVADALRSGFLQIDEDMIKDETMKDELAGTTAITVLFKSGKIYCANVGDSRAVASARGRADVLSIDHKPSTESETKRIIAAGGWVEFNRVNGNLALSRALGDFAFKKNDKKRPEEQIVTAFPDVQERNMSTDYEFIVLACDGIWDVLTNQEVVDFIRARIAQRMEPDIICEELMTRCLAPDCQMGGLGCDNMTVCLVCLLHGKPYEDLIRRCSQPSIGGPVPHLSPYEGYLK